MADDSPRVLVVVPARGGSKGIPRKNLQLLAGKPLVAHAVATGLAARLVTRVLCSTDDAQIADVARSAGAEVPFLRPAELAILRDCYHAAHRENAPVWNAAVQSFLARHQL